MVNKSDTSIIIGESLREFSHALCEIYCRINSSDESVVPSRDQFSDNVRDPLL